MDSGKRKNNYDSGSVGHDTDSTGPIENVVMTETVPSAEEDPEVGGEPLKRRTTDPPVVDAQASTVAEGPPIPGPSASAAAPRTLKDWISSIPATDQRQELFDNYASPHKKRRFKRKSFDEFVSRLTDEVTLVSQFT